MRFTPCRDESMALEFGLRKEREASKREARERLDRENRLQALGLGFMVVILVGCAP
jgi:hypothetical protein